MILRISSNNVSMRWIVFSIYIINSIINFKSSQASEQGIRDTGILVTGVVEGLKPIILQVMAGEWPIFLRFTPQFVSFS